VEERTKMKQVNLRKVSALVLSAALAAFAAFALAGCGSSDSSTTTSSSSSSDTVIRVGASPTPHAEILEAIKDEVAKEGFTLEIVEYNDYILPNTAVESGELDANYFQHITYLNNFNDENGTNLVNVADVHFEPFGLYSNTYTSLADLPEGAKIAVPNDTTNEARALLLLEQEGLIKLSDDAGLTATTLDIVENPKNLVINEIEAAQLPRTLDDVDLAAINGNYALQAGLDPASAIAVESDTSEAAAAYVNVVAVKAGNENTDKTNALVKAITSDTVKQFIEENYPGSVIAVF
jgi:D-methionine transport system substrate-binding protein